MSGTTIRRCFRMPRLAPTPISPGPSRVACQLALAHHVERLIESGKVKDYAEAAKELGLTRARLTQITNLGLLSPGIQGQILSEDLMVTERRLRTVTGEALWANQNNGL